MILLDSSLRVKHICSTKQHSEGSNNAEVQLRLVTPVKLENIMQKTSPVIAVYVFFAAFLVLSFFEKTLPAITALMPFVLAAVGIIAACLTFLPTLRTFGAFAAVVGLLFACEALAVSTGFPFGDIVFTRMPGPRILDVPIVIPFASLALLIPAWSASDRVLKYKHVVVASIIVTAAAGVLEFAADSLDLWHWSGGMPGELNFISWFGISYLCFSILSKYASEKESHPLVPHLLFAQLLYFILTDIAFRFLLPTH